jgi:hypothetical protein
VTTRRTAAIVAGLALSVSAGLGLGGCSSSPDASSSDSSAGAKDSLMASVRPLGTTTYAISLRTDTMTAVGSVDPAGNTATLTASTERDGEPVTIDVLTIAADSWAKMDLGATGETMGIDPKKWLKLDPAKLTARSLPFDRSDLADAFDLTDVLHGILSVSRTDAQHYSGSIDLTGAESGSSIIPTGTALGAAGKNVPFTATLDRQGRLIDLAVGRTSEGGASAFAFDLGISDYSAPAPVDRPDDNEVMTAPADAYPLLAAA